MTKPYRFTSDELNRLDVLYGERAVWLPLPMDELVAALVEAQARDLEMKPSAVVKGLVEDRRRASALYLGFGSLPTRTTQRPEEVSMSASPAITVEQLTDAITKQWPSSTLVEKKAYHRIALDRLTLGYAYLGGRKPAVEVVKADGSGRYDYVGIATKADLTRAISLMKAVEKRAAKKKVEQRAALKAAAAKKPAAAASKKKAS